MEEYSNDASLPRVDILNLNNDDDFIKWKNKLTDEEKHLSIDGYWDSIDGTNIRYSNGKYTAVNDIELWKAYLIYKNIDISKYRKPIVIEMIDRFSGIEDYIGFSKILRMDLIKRNLINNE